MKNLKNPQFGTRNRTCFSKTFSSINLFQQKWIKHLSYYHKRFRGILLLSKNGKGYYCYTFFHSIEAIKRLDSSLFKKSIRKSSYTSCIGMLSASNREKSNATIDELHFCFLSDWSNHLHFRGLSFSFIIRVGCFV